MDIELLRTFIAVTRARHFGRAAEQLYLTPAAVSARIRQLEQTLGVSLLHRTRGNIQMTPAGERLLPHARKLLGAWTDAQAELGLTHSEPQVFRLGYNPGLSPLLALLWLSHSSPQPWALNCQHTNALQQALLQERLDAAFIVNAQPQSGLVLHALGSLNLGCFESRPVDEQGPTCWIAFNWGISTPRPVDWTAAQEVRCDDWSLALQLLESRRAAIWLPPLMASQIPTLSPLPLGTDPCLSVNISLACLPGREQDLAFQWLLDHAYLELSKS